LGYIKRVHIALDASDLIGHKIDGTTVYVRELLPRLARLLIRRGHMVTVFSPLKIDNCDFGGANTYVAKGRRFWTQTVLSRALFRVKPDLLFLPIQTVPLYRPAELKVVATVHDLDFFDYPQMYDAGNLFLLRWFTRVVARNATRIIAVSANTKADIVKHYGREAADIDVVHHGYDRKMFRPPVSEEERQGASENLQRKYGVSGGYIFFVGALQPRKNIIGLISAFETLKKNNRPEHLVIVSGNAWKEEKIINRIKSSAFSEHIHLIRNVSSRDLTDFYWCAKVFVLPSFAEGFGLPVIEAMASGTPVVTSNGSALAEVAKGAARLIDPNETKDIAAGILDLLTNASLREKLRGSGMKVASDFSWDKCAEETASVIEKVLTKD